jgi:hypothetical protein
VPARASGRKNRLVRISDDSIRSEREHGCFVLQTESRFLYWKFDIVRSLYINASFHHLHCITPINANSLLRSMKQEEGDKY